MEKILDRMFTPFDVLPSNLVEKYIPIFVIGWFLIPVVGASIVISTQGFNFWEDLVAFLLLLFLYYLIARILVWFYSILHREKTAKPIRGILTPLKILPLGYYRLLLVGWFFLPLLLSIFSQDSFVLFIVLIVAYYPFARTIVWVWKGFQTKDTSLTKTLDREARIVVSIQDGTKYWGNTAEHMPVKIVKLKDGTQCIVDLGRFPYFEQDCFLNEHGETEMGKAWYIDPETPLRSIYNHDPIAHLELYS